MNQLADMRAIVVGASRGLGRGVAEAFLGEGASVVAVARDTSPLSELAAGHKLLQLEAGDATDPAVADQLLRQYRPDIVALVAGAAWKVFALDTDRLIAELTDEASRPRVQTSVSIERSHF